MLLRSRVPGGCSIGLLLPTNAAGGAGRRASNVHEASDHPPALARQHCAHARLARAGARGCAGRVTFAPSTAPPPDARAAAPALEEAPYDPPSTGAPVPAGAAVSELPMPLRSCQVRKCKRIPDASPILSVDFLGMQHILPSFG